MQAFANNIRDALAKFPAEKRDEVVLLFSAHSLPMQVSIVAMSCLLLHQCRISFKTRSVLNERHSS